MINFGVIGTGHIGKRHAEMIVRSNESNLISLCDVRSKSELELKIMKQTFTIIMPKCFKITLN